MKILSTGMNNYDCSKRQVGFRAFRPNEEGLKAMGDVIFNGVRKAFSPEDDKLMSEAMEIAQEHDVFVSPLCYGADNYSKDTLYIALRPRLGSALRENDHFDAGKYKDSKSLAAAITDAIKALAG